MGKMSILLAVSLGYSFGYEPLASFTARTRAMGSAPIRKCVRIDVNTHDDVPICLESTLHFLGNLQPFRPGAWHPIAVGESFKQRRIIAFVDPVTPTAGSDLSSEFVMLLILQLLFLLP